jgi:hypothetical protein
LPMGSDVVCSLRKLGEGHDSMRKRSDG